MYLYDRSGQIPRSDSGVTCAAQLSKLQKPRGPAAPVPRNSIALSRTGNRHGKMDEKTLSAFAATVEKYNSYRHVSV